METFSLENKIINYNGLWHYALRQISGLCVQWSNMQGKLLYPSNYSLDVKGPCVGPYLVIQIQLFLISKNLQ